MRKNNAFVAKIVNTRLTKIFMAIFAPHKRLPTSATLVPATTVSNFEAIQVRAKSSVELLKAYHKRNSDKDVGILIC